MPRIVTRRPAEVAAVAVRTLEAGVAPTIAAAIGPAVAAAGLCPAAAPSAVGESRRAAIAIAAGELRRPAIASMSEPVGDVPTIRVAATPPVMMGLSAVPPAPREGVTIVVAPSARTGMMATIAASPIVVAPRVAAVPVVSSARPAVVPARLAAAALGRRQGRECQSRDGGEAQRDEEAASPGPKRMTATWEGGRMQGGHGQTPFERGGSLTGRDMRPTGVRRGSLRGST